MTGTANHKVLLSHVQIIVIGEELAKEGIMDPLDFFERDHGFNLRADILVAKGITAKQILNGESELEKIPAVHLISIMKNEKDVANIKRIMLTDLLKEIGSSGKDPAIGVIETMRKKEKLLIEDMKVERAAVFKKDKLVGWLTPLETRGLLFVEDKVQSGIINISNPLDRSKKIGIEITRSVGKKMLR